MAGIVREVTEPGKYVFKVYDEQGALMFHGSSEATAQVLGKRLREIENARQARKTVSDKSSD